MQAPEPTAYCAAFTTFTAPLDLTAQTGYPGAPADRIVIVNQTAGTLSATVTDKSGKQYAISVRAASEWVEEHAIASIDAATADTMTQIRAYWRSDAGPLNP